MITLFISSGIEKAKVENYKGRKISEVVAELTDLGIDQIIKLYTDLQFLTEEKDTIVNRNLQKGKNLIQKQSFTSLRSVKAVRKSLCQT